MSNDEEICYPLPMSYSMLLYRELERKAEMELSMDIMNCWRNGTEHLLLLRFIFRPVMRVQVTFCEYRL
jgi:hypothetical protein